MKQLYFIIAIVISFSVQAQKDVYLQIHHFLGNQTFQFNQAATSSLNEEFELTRMEYYMGAITLYFDDGTDTVIKDKWILVNASATADELLGTFNFNAIDSIGFAIGVEAEYNHNDPAAFPAGHPLAPQSPSMHWGWIAGYRFVALEGLTVPDGDMLQIHALGDNNYWIQTIATNGYISGNDVVIKLKADYVEALKDITVDGGLVYHGELYEGADMLENFYKYVFTEAPANVGIVELNNDKINIYPNPVNNHGDIYFPVSDDFRQMKIYSITGKLIMMQDVPFNGKVKLNVPSQGIYFGKLVKEGKIISVNKILVIN